MCNCGCNTCETKGPLLTEGKVKSLLSEGLQYHIDKKIPLFETVYRIGSDKHLALIKEARKMYSRNVIDLCEDDEALIKTHLGEFALYEGVSVPLDLPMLEEEVNSGDLDNALYRLEKVYKYLDIEYKETRRGEKYIQINYIPVTSPQSQNPEFVNVRYNNDEDLGVIKKRLGLPMSEQTYSGFLRNPEDPDSEKFEPTGSVAQFREELRALFGKFKGDLKNPEFIKGVAQIMVNWKSLLRSQMDESKYDKEETIQQTIDRLKARIEDPNDGGNVPFLVQKIKDLEKSLNEDEQLDEKKKAKKKEKKDPPLNKPKRGGSKAYYVYVRDPKTKKIKKVSFGSGGLRAKIKNKEARNAFAARHNCKNKKDRTKAGYWSCNLPRYASALGLGANMNTFW